MREWEIRLTEGRARLHEGERLLNEREEALDSRDEVLKQTSKELDETRIFFEKERALIQQSDVDNNARALALSEKEKVFTFQLVLLVLNGKLLDVLAEQIAVCGLLYYCLCPITATLAPML